jgi:hypothetical protein
LGGRPSFDQAHAAIAGDRQALVVAEARNFGARGLAGLQFDLGPEMRIRPWIGQAAASPSAQMVWPSICLVTSSSMSISRFSARPSAMRVITRHIQPVPSRHGVHWPQLSCL